MSDSIEKLIDPAATDETSENARNAAMKKRRDPQEPVAVVGLGASAGGIAVLQQFFSDMPAESGLAFVVVMHLSPEHESNLDSILQQKTSMPVTQVNEPVKVRRNHVYVIPPNRQLTFEDSTLHLVPPQQAPGRRVTIDLFFRSLAQAYGQRAVCVILSGTDSDGVIGLKHVRAQGGVTMAQDPSEAEHDSMPVTAISTGMVDWVLPVSEMPAKLMEFVGNEARMQLPPEIPEAEEPQAKDREAPGGETVSKETRDSKDETALAEVLVYLRGQTGHDFGHYKRATVLRRIARRLQVNSVETIPQYLEFLRRHPAEARALLQDLLIGVTHFFRDRESFAALEAHIPQLFAGKQSDDQLRIWVAGCSTGEEAYSIAMLLCEHAERLERPPTIQVFASDVDEQAIQDARDGLYPSTIEADVSLERLRRFFNQDHGRYRVKKNLREKVLFAAHNLLRDPPFSRVDLVSCRNLLIYLNAKGQEQVFDIFHFALRAGGLLFIGGSESGGNVQTLFSAVDAKHRLYVRRSVPRPIWKIPLLPPRALDPASRSTLLARPRMLPPLTKTEAKEAADDNPESAYASQERRAVLFGELHLKLLEEYGPPSVVVNEAHDIVHLSEHAGRYLHFVAGEPTANLLKVVNPALRIELRTALFRAAQEHETVRTTSQTLDLEGKREAIALQVRPMQPEARGPEFFLVVFEPQTGVPEETPAPGPHEAVSRELDDEIQFLKDQLNTTVEQYEATNEELKAANEELQATNEEMRSATEELETSKEELQSVNEELVTVNHELKSSVEELSHTNADLTNLMSSTDIGTIFLDRQLRIQRFTPSAKKIFNLIPADLDRPLADITHKLTYEGLITDAERVLENLVSLEKEVRLGNDEWYLVRIAPYRTADDRIAGVVATFINISARRRVEQELRVSEERIRLATRAARVFIWEVNLQTNEQTNSENVADVLGFPLGSDAEENFKLVHPEDRAAALEKFRSVLEEDGSYDSECRFISPINGEIVWARAQGHVLRDAAGKARGLIGITQNTTARKSGETALRESEERFRQFAENSADVFWIVDAATQQIEYINPVYEEMWGEPRDAIMADADHWLQLVHPDDRVEARKRMPQVLAGKTVVLNYRIVRPNDGATRWIRDTAFPIRDDQGVLYRVAGVAQDLTDDQLQAAALRESEERYRLLVEGARDYAIFLLDTANTIVHWSSGAERIFGWTAEEAVGQSGQLIFTPEDRARKQEEKEIEIALRDGSAPDRRWHLRKDGERLWIDGVMRRLDDNQNGALRGFAKIARDATEERAAEIALRAAHDEMEERVVDRTRELVAINAELERTMTQRQELEKELLEISEREKRRIGEDLHDMVCQELTATALFLKSSANRLEKESPAAAKSLEESAQIVNRNVGVARDLARGLQPADLKGTGLKQALRALVAQIGETSEVMIHFKAARDVRITDDTIALHLYRVAQEALNNAIKHAGAKNILLTLDRNEENVCVSVQDDGKGFSPKRRSKGLGLHLMRYRANALGGELKIEKRKHGGMDITCVIPMKR